MRGSNKWLWKGIFMHPVHGIPTLADVFVPDHPDFRAPNYITFRTSLLEIAPDGVPWITFDHPAVYVTHPDVFKEGNAALAVAKAKMAGMDDDIAAWHRDAAARGDKPFVYTGPAVPTDVDDIDAAIAALTAKMAAERGVVYKDGSKGSTRRKRKTRKMRKSRRRYL